MSEIYILYIIGAILGCLILYYLIKAAVKNGIIEALNDKKTMPNISYGKPENSANTEQMKLQHRYDNGEITFEVYKAEWSKLSS